MELLLHVCFKGLTLCWESDHTAKTAIWLHLVTQLTQHAQGFRVIWGEIIFIFKGVFKDGSWHFVQNLKQIRLKMRNLLLSWLIARFSLFFSSFFVGFAFLCLIWLFFYLLERRLLQPQPPELGNDGSEEKLLLHRRAPERKHTGHFNLPSLAASPTPLTGHSLDRRDVRGGEHLVYRLHHVTHPDQSCGGRIGGGVLADLRRPAADVQTPASVSGQGGHLRGAVLAVRRVEA